MLDEDQNGQDCVDIYYSRALWGDHECTYEANFVCERRKCNCKCKYNGQEFDCGTTIQVLDKHACSFAKCGSDGTIGS